MSKETTERRHMQFWLSTGLVEVVFPDRVEDFDLQDADEMFALLLRRWGRSVKRSVANGPLICDGWEGVCDGIA